MSYGWPFGPVLSIPMTARGDFAWPLALASNRCQSRSTREGALLRAVASRGGLRYVVRRACDTPTTPAGNI